MKKAERTIQVHEGMKAAEMITALESVGIKTYSKDTTADLRQRILDFNNGKLKPAFVKSDFAYNGIRAALVLAQNTNNRRAINAPMCKKAGVPEERLEFWKHAVNNLREAVKAYIEVRRDYSVSDKEVAERRDEITKEWKKLIKQGEPSLFHSRLSRVCNAIADTEDLISFCWTFIKSDNGTAPAIETEEIFRKQVETLIGCLIAGYDLRTEEENAKISEYYTICGKIRNTKVAINGDKKQGGLKKDISILQSNLGKTEAILKQLGADTDTLAQMLNPIKDDIKNKQKELTEKEKELKKLEEELPAIEAEAKDIFAKINKAE